MKKIILVLLIALIHGKLHSQLTFIQDSLGNDLYVHARAIVKVHSAAVKLEVINNKSIQSGTVSDFVNDNALPFLGTQYGGVPLGDFTVKKVFRNMVSADTITVSRLGDTIEQDKHWTTFIIEWPSDAGFTVPFFCDSVQKFFPLVQYAHPDYAVAAASPPNDSLYDLKQYSLHDISNTYPDGHIHIEGAWDITTGDTVVRTGIFDSGIQWAHEDFGGGTFSSSKVKGGFDYVNNQDISLVTTDAFGHGTKTAGIIGAIRNNNKGIAGIAGGDGTITTGTSLYAMKINDNSGSAPVSTIADAIVEGASNNPNTGFGFGLHVASHGWYIPASNSLFTGQNIELIRDALRTAFRNNMVNVVARGNEGSTIAALPATIRDEWNISVGAHDQFGKRTTISNYGQEMDILAPGDEDIVYTTNNQNSGAFAYTDFNGTSAATPHVAGVAALILSHTNTVHTNSENLAPEDVEYLIQRYAIDLKAPPYSSGYDLESGWGRLHADSVLKHIKRPNYKIWHFSWKNMSANFASSIPDTTMQLFVTENYTENGNTIIPSGTYFTVDRHRFQLRVRHSNANSYSAGNIPTSNKIIGSWARNSSTRALWQFANNQLSPENTLEISNVTQDSATVTGYIYNFRNTNIGGTFRSSLWKPTSLNGVVDFAYSIYTYDSLATGLIEFNTIDFEGKIYPNPAQKNVTFSFSTYKTQDVWFEIYDIQGKQLYKSPKERLHPSASHSKSINVEFLPEGMYFAKICSALGNNTYKLVILK